MRRYCEIGLPYLIVLSEAHDYADAPYPIALLCARRDRAECGTDKQRDELTPFQSIKLHPTPPSREVVQRSEIAKISQGAGGAVRQSVVGKISLTPASATDGGKRSASAPAPRTPRADTLPPRHRPA
jgi:hypothetical protein